MRSVTRQESPQLTQEKSSFQELPHKSQSCFLRNQVRISLAPYQWQHFLNTIGKVCDNIAKIINIIMNEQINIYEQYINEQ